MKFNWKLIGEMIIENGTYKLVALFITLSLWVFIFERQVSVYTKSLKLDFLLAPQHYIVNKVVREVQFKVKGPRMAVKRFVEGSDSINVDLSNSGPGRTMVRIYDDILELPSNVSVVSVPSNIYVEIEKRDATVTIEKADSKEPEKLAPKAAPKMAPKENGESSGDKAGENAEQN